MPAPTNTFLTTTPAVGMREDLTDLIKMISPTETPVMMMAERRKASATYHEWQEDHLAAPAANTAAEGDDAVAEAAIATERLGNRLQILDKVASVSGTLESVAKAGRKSEMARQMMKRSKELKRDIEIAFCQNASSASADPRRAAGLESMISSTPETTGTGDLHVSHGVGGSTPGFSGGNWTAPTDGTQRAITEDILKTVLRGAWTYGGEPDVVLCGPVNKQKISAFTGPSITKYHDMKDKTIWAGVDVYESDFGEVKIVPSRFNRERTVLVLDPSVLGIAYLRPIRSWELAKSGDSMRRQILGELTFVLDHRAACGKVADLTTT